MVAIYARQSVDKKDSISIESQIDNCEKELENEDYKTYIDKGYSGKNIERPQFIEMMKDIEAGIISKVIVYKIDRISRALIDFAKIVETFKKYKVEFISRTEKFDTTNPMGKAMLSIIMVFAQLERETIQLRVKDNYYERGRQGFYLGGVAPFGFNKIETQHQGKKTYTFSENIEQAQIVCNLFDEYSGTGISLGKLADKLNKAGITTNFNKAWSGVSLGRLLRNPIYVQANADVYLYLKSKGATMNNDVGEYIGENGCSLYAERHSITTSKFTDLSNSFVTIALHKGIINADIWLACQYKLDTNKQVKNSGKGTHTWLSGLIKCGYCGYAINVVNNNRGNSYINCGGRKLKICNERKRVIQISDIEEIVETQLLSRIKSIKVDGVQEVAINSVELNQLKIKVVDIDNRIHNLMDKLASSNDIVMDYINKEISKLDIEKKENIKKILLLSNENLKPKYENMKLEDCVNEWKDYSFEEKKALAKVFIKKVVVTDDEISVFYN